MKEFRKSILFMPIVVLSICTFSMIIAYYQMTNYQNTQGLMGNIATEVIGIIVSVIFIESLLRTEEKKAKEV